MKRLLSIALPACCLLACQQTPPAPTHTFRTADQLAEEAKNRRVARTFEDFIAGPNYTESRDIWRGRAIEQYAPRNSRVEILLKEQRGRLYINGEIAMDFPICSGRVGGHETPRGSFRITQKAREHRSSLYGCFVDGEDKIVKSGVTASQKAPAGARFRGTTMPYWMRFNGAIGMHVGDVFRTEASHGCVRVPVEACSILFEKLAVGSQVIVK